MKPPISSKSTVGGTARKLTKSVANAGTIERLTQQLVWLLETFHKSREKSGSSPETEFWRGNFVGTKRTLFSIYGEAVIDDILSRVRQTSGLPIPHRGPLGPDGAPLGFDSDADV